MALQAAHAEHQRYEAAKLNLIYRVKNIYYEYGYLAQAIEIAKDNVILLTHLESVARAKYKGGAGLQSAVIKAQVELGKLEDRLLLPARSDEAGRSAKLNIALNRPSHFPLPKPKPLPAEATGFIGCRTVLFVARRKPKSKGFGFHGGKRGFRGQTCEKRLFPGYDPGCGLH